MTGPGQLSLISEVPGMNGGSPSSPPGKYTHRSACERACQLWRLFRSFCSLSLSLPLSPLDGRSIHTSLDVRVLGLLYNGTDPITAPVPDYLRVQAIVQEDPENLRARELGVEKLLCGASSGLWFSGSSTGRSIAPRAEYFQVGGSMGAVCARILCCCFRARQLVSAWLHEEGAPERSSVVRRERLAAGRGPQD